MLVDRLAILLVIAKSRHGGFDLFFLDRQYDEEGSLGDEIREWPDYKTARKVINRWLNNIEKADD